MFKMPYVPKHRKKVTFYPDVIPPLRIVSYGNHKGEYKEGY